MREIVMYRILLTVTHSFYICESIQIFVYAPDKSVMIVQSIDLVIEILLGITLISVSCILLRFPLGSFQ